jgi:protein-disulfide isomerase/uncharacterized membrane protein
MTTLKLKHFKKTLSNRAYFVIILIFVLIGLFVSAYLSLLHYQLYTNMGYKSFCAITQAINCDTVAQSKFAILFNVPTAVWGIIGYLVLLFLLFIQNESLSGKRPWVMILSLATILLGCSLGLAYISISKISSYCILCIITYTVNLFLLYYCWLAWRRFDPLGIKNGFFNNVLFIWQKKRYFVSAAALLIAVLILSNYYPQYWKISIPELRVDISSGITEDGHPWIGAEKPELIIVEYYDYRCFQCRKIHYHLRKLIEQYPDKLRIVHRHYPMDHKYNPMVKTRYHEGAGDLALLAIYAQTKGKFWEMNDLLFSIDKYTESISLKDLASRVGLDSDELPHAMYEKQIKDILYYDISRGVSLNIQATPTFIIGDKVYVGRIPIEIFKNIFE